MSKLIPVAASLLAAALLLSQSPPAVAPFLEKPYLQIGDAPELSAAESLVVLWAYRHNSGTMGGRGAHFKRFGVARGRPAVVADRVGAGW